VHHLPLLTRSYSLAHTIDLVLLSHGDLAHSGLYPYAYSRWNLKAPTYTTLPVQAMARIATTEDVEGIRDEEDVGDDEGKVGQEDESMDLDQESKRPTPKNDKVQRKYVATLHEVQDAFNSVNTLRYSQPTHLQGLGLDKFLAPRSNVIYYRKMPRINHHTFQCGAHTWRYNMENTVPVLWHNYLCCRYESYARTPSGRHRPHETSSWRSF